MYPLGRRGLSAPISFVRLCSLSLEPCCSALVLGFSGLPRAHCLIQVITPSRGRGGDPLGRLGRPPREVTFRLSPGCRPKERQVGSPGMGLRFVQDGRWPAVAGARATGLQLERAGAAAASQEWPRYRGERPSQWRSHGSLRRTAVGGEEDGSHHHRGEFGQWPWVLCGVRATSFTFHAEVCTHALTGARH